MGGFEIDKFKFNSPKHIIYLTASHYMASTKEIIFICCLATPQCSWNFIFHPSKFTICPLKRRFHFQLPPFKTFRAAERRVVSVKTDLSQTLWRVTRIQVHNPSSLSEERKARDAARRPRHFSARARGASKKKAAK